MLAFRIAAERWMKSDNDEPFQLHAAAALSDLQVRAAELDSRPRPSAGSVKLSPRREEESMQAGAAALLNPLFG
jgi:hypothetical protein